MIESALKKYLENTGSAYAQVVYDAMAYSIFGAGKRIRPSLTLMPRLIFAEFTGLITSG